MKTVLVLGAKSDIAQALARKYAEDGYELMLAARNAASLNDFSSDLKIRYGVSVLCLEFDVLDFSSHETFLDELPELPNGIICAIGYLVDQSIAEKDPKEARKTIDTNFTGPATFLGLVAKELETQGNGFIVGISSVAGERGRKSNYYYGSAKAGFTEYLSGLRNRLYSSGVHVLTVKPGFVQTRMTEHLDLPKLLTASAEKAASDIFRAQKKRRNICYTIGLWRWIMLVIKSIPEAIFKKMSI